MDPLKLENNLESVLKSSKDYQKYKKLLITDLELQINLVIQEIEQHLLSKDLFLLENIVTNINQQQFDYKLREAQRRLEVMGKTMDNLLQKYGKIDQNALEQQVMEYRLQDLEKKATNFIEQ
ncbi:hypothetical protein PPERSA_03468 [Pseudocohnilembus persalinus]|uniref:Uncharacterized protein n=1 Tax=Pseudocohnilembus persalinus TaxID=266149 RepID=A0A0V0QBQ9_PSEPJ|nr:hypothetical protein PPERSA_03468 [Pseudocohnilembus persalinus]|eukprot:KRW99667.1 hypothetical protein PPERSA_03468 [Pseudocohnilembus persalinus]